MLGDFFKAVKSICTVMLTSATLGRLLFVFPLLVYCKSWQTLFYLSMHFLTSHICVGSAREKKRSSYVSFAKNNNISKERKKRKTIVLLVYGENKKVVVFGKGVHFFLYGLKKSCKSVPKQQREKES